MVNVATHYEAAPTDHPGRIGEEGWVMGPELTGDSGIVEFVKVSEHY